MRRPPLPYPGWGTILGYRVAARFKRNRLLDLDLKKSRII
jgi:hypothetical protein